MNVIVISPTIQEFNGERYYLCGNYFQRKGKRLHRAVWEYHHGPVPKGYHVHHKTHDRSKNGVDDLELLPKKKHLSLHANMPENKAAKRERMLKILIPKAAEWHRSEKGRAWHSKHAKKKKKRYMKTCEVCGETFATAHVGRGRFCSGRCKAKNLRRVRRENKKHSI